MAFGWLGCLALPVFVPVLVLAISGPPPGPVPVDVSGSRMSVTGPVSAAASFYALRTEGPPDAPRASRGDCPFSINIECPSHDWPYSVAIVLTNDSGDGAWYASVDIVADGRTPFSDGLTGHTRVIPADAGRGGSVFLAPGLARRVVFFVDPSGPDDPEALQSACVLIRWGREPQGMTGTEMCPVDFPVWDSFVSSGFRMESDGYRFKNVNDCYGMAATAALYYEGLLALPAGASSTFELSRDEAFDRIHAYQTSHTNSLGTLAARLRPGPPGRVDLQFLRTRLCAGTPVIAWLAESRLGGAHVVLVRALLEDESHDVGVLAVYDPNHSYASPLGFDVQAFQVMRCELSSGRLFHEPYSGFAFGTAAVIPENT